jgi:hypothetical protein
MEQELTMKISFNAKPKDRSERGGLKLRLEDGVDNDGKSLVERNWKYLARNRQIWKNLLLKVTT